MNKICLLLIGVALAGGHRTAFARNWAMASVDDAGFSYPLRQALRDLDVRTIAELSLASRAELARVRTGEPFRATELLAFVSTHGIATASSAFPELTWAERIRLDRLCVRTLTDYFANEDVLKDYLGSPPGLTALRPVWIVRRGLEIPPVNAPPLVRWRAVPLYSVVSVELANRLKRLGPRTVGELLLMSAAELEADVPGGRASIATWHTFLARHRLQMDVSPFPHEPLAERLRRYRFGLITRDDFEERGATIARRVSARPIAARRPKRLVPVLPPSAAVDWENLPLEDAPLENRLVYALTSTGFRTVGEALTLTPAEFAKLALVGSRLLGQFKKFVKERGVPWPETDFYDLPAEHRLLLHRRGVRNLEDLFADRARLDELARDWPLVAEKSDEWRARLGTSRTPRPELDRLARELESLRTEAEGLKGDDARQIGALKLKVRRLERCLQALER